MEEPEDRQHLLDTMEWIGWDRLLFASDYPHWDFDDPFRAFPRRPAAERTGRSWRPRTRSAVYPAVRLMAGSARWPATWSPRPRKFHRGRASSWTIGERAIVILNVKGELFALSDKCPHKGGSLSRGKLTGVVTSSAPGQYDYSAPGRDPALPLARLGVRRAHGPLLVRPQRMRLMNYAVSVEPGAKLVEGPYVAETFPVTVEDDYVVVETK